MPLTLVWGKTFKFEQTALSSGDTYDEIFGVDGGTLGISWKSIRDMKALSAEYGVAENLWPVYPDCDLDSAVPLDDARTKSTELRTALEGVPDRVVSQDYWLNFLSGLLREGNVFFIMA